MPVVSTKVDKKTDEQLAQSAAALNTSKSALLRDFIEKYGTGNKPEVALITISPEREYLRKLSGLPPMSQAALDVPEEKYLKDLREAILADVTETLLLEHNSIPIIFKNKLQERMFKQMQEARAKIASKDIAPLQDVLQKAVLKAFFDNASSLYNSGLFKATYGFSYNEFKACFSE